ncbi:uncharacterized protein PAC_08530 [Phialocephala subalpina]|uniref:Heterokaryon incompatibility domain-containing protein n=1 Tax=Phialocephala subalpina TaxID=576137 RepID=A0A1L7X0U1_9HELO|nr:uncharacterized protein PAC_08530 [Phialocephala subalpina]
MGIYYSQSWLTLAAGLDYESGLGLYEERYPSDVVPGYYCMKAPIPQHSCLYFARKGESTKDNRAASDLYTRAWTLQEEALSPRFLIFQPRETILRIDDKLPALSGLARHYQERYGGIYLAGIWPESLIDQICWCINYLFGPQASNNWSKPADYRAPLWTWASIDGQIIFDETSEVLKEGDLEILTASTTPVGRDPMERVSNGRYGSWYYAYAISSKLDSGDMTENPQQSHAKLILDLEDNETKELELWSLPLKPEFALALVPVKGTTARIGAILWRNDEDDGYGNESRAITII